VYSKFSGLSR